MENLGFPTVDVPQEAAGERDAALRFLVDQLVSRGALPRQHADTTMRALLKREDLGSTGIGHGVAIPHTTSLPLEGVIGILGRVPAGIDWKSIDGQPVRTICMVLAPVDKPARYLKTLEAVARALKSDKV